MFNHTFRYYRKILTIIGVIMLSVLMISPVSMLFHYGSQTAVAEVYSSGNEIVEIQGTGVSIGFGGNMYPVSWKVLQYVPAAISSTPQSTSSTSGPIVQQEFSNYKTNRIESSVQNSVALIMWNHYERIAEIYTFMPNGIDASLAMTNLIATNATMIPTFSIQQKQQVQGQSRLHTIILAQ